MLSICANTLRYHYHRSRRINTKHGIANSGIVHDKNSSFYQPQMLPRPNGQIIGDATDISRYLRTMLQAIYDWTLALATHRHAKWALASVSFAESSFFPIPPDIMLIPMILAERAKAWTLAFISTFSSTFGGLAGYAIGLFLFDTVGGAILSTYGLHDEFANLTRRYHEYGAWIVFIAGITPIPYKLITITSGAVSLDIAVFMVASLLSRGLRFFAIAGLLYWLGPTVRSFIERRLTLVFMIFIISLVGGFLIIKYVI